MARVPFSYLVPISPQTQRTLLLRVPFFSVSPSAALPFDNSIIPTTSHNVSIEINHLVPVNPEFESSYGTLVPFIWKRLIMGIPPISKPNGAAKRPSWAH
jgi:hypothetical protein